VEKDSSREQQLMQQALFTVYILMNHEFHAYMYDESRIPCIYERTLHVNVLQCVAVCCSVLQCVTACCSVSQCVTVCCSVLQSVQCVAVSCCVTYGSCATIQVIEGTATQCVAVCCSVLQCVVVC